jgi:hypothetical protein
MDRQMSYLDIPRIHFAGAFTAQPSTVNNIPTNYAPGATLNNLWNPMGSHNFSLDGCVVKSAVGTDGNPAPTDPVVGGDVVTTNTPGYARLVDLDPAFQLGSQVWGAEIKVGIKGGAGQFVGKLQTVGFRDLFKPRARTAGLDSMGAVYQSSLDNGKFTTVDSSPILKALSKHTSGIAIKFVVYAYNATTKTGKVVGTIGPFGSADGDEEIVDIGVHFLQARSMSDAGAKAFGRVPFKLNAGKKRLTLDLGNAIPEVDAAGTRFNLGDLTAVILPPSPAAPIVLGKLDYSQTHYEQTAGIEQMTLTADQVKKLQTNPLGLTISQPAQRLILTERPKGLYVDTTEKVFRMEPGDTASFKLVAMAFGKPKSGLKLELKLLSGTPADGIKFPASVNTSGSGVASVTLTAGDPKNPRGAVDGQLYEIGFFSAAAAPSTQEGSVFVHVYDKFTVPAKPVYANVKPILDQYAQLYPLMKLMLDLSDLGKMQASKDRMIRTMEYPLEDPRYMPVTRDLSPSKAKTLLAWLKAGCP